MKKYLNYILQIVHKDLTGKISTYENLTSTFVMNNNVSQEEIIKCDNYFNQKLPYDYKIFLSNYNGGILFKVGDHSGFHFFGADELIKNDKFQRENFGQDWDEKIILFCECIGDAEYLGFRLNGNYSFEIIHCIMDLLPEDWIVVENSFDELMDKIIEERGRKFWFSE